MSSLLLSFAILSSSFFGSWHCAAMCGPVASLMAQRQSLRAYHLGRGFAYVFLGAIAGMMGQVFLDSQFIFLRGVAAAVLALTLMLMGVALVKPSWRFWNSHSVSQRMAAFFRNLGFFKVSHSGFAVGLLTGFLPCGWLYTFVLAAIATKSAPAGALTLLLFWLGGLPALIAVPSMIRGTIRGVGLNQQRIAGGVLVLAGVYSLASFFWFHS